MKLTIPLNLVRINKYFKWKVCLLLLLVFQIPMTVYADYTQDQLYQLGINYFDVNDGSGGGCSSGGTVLSGSDNEEKAFNYFLGKGLTAAQAAGIVGNLMQESGVNPNSSSGGGGTIGIAQWEGDRDDKLKALANKEGKPYTDLGVQLDYLWSELSGGYKNVLDNLKKSTTYQDATNQFVGPDIYPSGQPADPTYEGRRQGGFENPGTPVMSNRLKYAGQIFEKSGGTTSATTTSDSSGGGCASVSPDCSGATGSAKILCAAKAYDTASYLLNAGPRNGPAWHKQCPTIGPSCKIDCSLLVTLAVYDAFKVVLPGTDTDGERADIGKYWEKVSLDKAQPGDILQPETEHVEVIDHIKGNTIYTFGAHTDSYPQPKQVSPASYQYSSGMLLLHFKGADS